MATTLGAQPLKLLALVSVPTLSDELCVGIIRRPRSATLPTGDREPLLG